MHSKTAVELYRKQTVHVSASVLVTLIGCAIACLALHFLVEVLAQSIFQISQLPKGFSVVEMLCSSRTVSSMDKRTCWISCTIMWKCWLWTICCRATYLDKTSNCFNASIMHRLIGCVESEQRQSGFPNTTRDCKPVQLQRNLAIIRRETISLLVIARFDPRLTALHQLVNICRDYVAEHDIGFNYDKTLNRVGVNSVE